MINRHSNKTVFQFYKNPILDELFKNILNGNMPVFGHPMLDYDIITKKEPDPNEEQIGF